MVEWIIEPLRDAADLDGVLDVDVLSFTRPWTRAMYESEFLNRDTSRMFVLRTPAVPWPATAPPGSSSTRSTSTTSPCGRSCAGRGSDRRCSTHVLEEGRAAAPRAPRSKCGARTTMRGGCTERFGFRVAGVRRDYYTDPTEDALVLWREEAIRTVTAAKCSRHPGP